MADAAAYEEALRHSAEIGESPWFQAGYLLMRQLGQDRPPMRWVWILPTEEARGARLIFNVPVKIVDGVEPHLAIELPAV
ncbi:hypothetical protein GCM10027258_62670 [Amycolatopsis stemonae]